MPPSPRNRSDPSSVGLLDEVGTVSQLTEPLLTPADDLSVASASQNDQDDDAPSFSGLLLFKSLYFLNGLSGATWGRFGVIYYNSVKHLSPEQIGVLQGVLPLLGFITMPLWGYVADMVHSRKSVYIFCKVMSTVSLLSLSLESVNTFPLIFLCVFGMAIFRASGVLDAHTLDFLGDKHRTIYGTIRLWTAVSWGLGCVIMGSITDSYGFRWNFSLFGVMMTLVIVITACGLPARSKSEQARYDLSNEGAMVPRPPTTLLVEAICRGPVFLWLLEVAVIGAGMSLVDSFLFVFLQNELGASTALCGYTVGITVLFELPVFHYSQFLLRHLGHDFLFVSAMVAYVFRVLGYTLLTPSSVHWVLLLEILHGITFACMWIASVDFSGSIAPEEWSTTVQSILSMTMSSFGGGIGPMVGGYVMERWGPVFMYRGAGWIVGGVCVVHLVAWLGCRKGHDDFLQSLSAEHVQRRNA